MMSDLPLLAVLCASLVGAALGCLTGLFPGVHSNNVASVLGSNPGPVIALVAVGSIGMGGEGSGLLASAAVVACAVAHTVANIVPTVFLAIPGEEVVPSVLPGHRLAMAGMGHDALRVSVLSSITALTVAMALVVPVHAVMGSPGGLYRRSTAWLGPALLTMSLVMVMAEARGGGGWSGAGGRLRGRAAALAALAVVSTAGILGHLALFSAGMVTPLFIGLFGIPSLLVAMAGRGGGVLASREVEGPDRRATPWGSVVRGTLAGTVVGWFPGVSSAQATFMAGGARGADDPDGTEGARRFIASVSAVNTANVVFNLVALATLLRVRSGAASAVAGLTAWTAPPWEASGLPGTQVALLLASAAVGGLVAAPLTLSAGVWVHHILPVLANKLVLWSLVVLMVAVVAATSGWYGFGVTVVASALGMRPPLLGLMRVHLMGALTVPLALGLILG
jgi:putative membrane protein